ncbi:hypothetical protein ACQPXB_28395 [Amycolatopsis sp. CA-161197]|uniref:acyl-CoA-like ligand-binding transcription factor n=1 Tax=Amycolatopsis sp. CA-161197 TaxID=3239922 RepID=UPI003D8D91EE
MPSDVVALSTGRPTGSLYPLAVGRSVLPTCRAAYERWSTRADADLPGYLDAAKESPHHGAHRVPP